MTSQPYDAVIVGAGFAGIGAAIQLKRMGYENFVILEREDDLGGTWYVNHYPGLACDVPTTTYSYFFAPNPNWSRLFSTGSEIKQYADDVADKYDVRRHMRFSTTVEGARWDEDAQLWLVALAGGETLRSQFLILATGYLCQPKTPDVPGIESFGGRVLHAMLTAKLADRLLLFLAPRVLSGGTHFVEGSPFGLAEGPAFQIRGSRRLGRDLLLDLEL